MWYMNIHLYPIMFDDVPTQIITQSVTVNRWMTGKIFVLGDLAVAGTGAAYTRRNKDCDYECVVGSGAYFK